MEWKVERTQTFDKWWDKEGVANGNYKYHEEALKQFNNRISLTHDVQCPFFRNIHYECWSVRMPDKIRHQGKRGGFRVVFVIDLNEKILFLQGIMQQRLLV